MSEGKKKRLENLFKQIETFTRLMNSANTRSEQNGAKNNTTANGNTQRAKTTNSKASSRNGERYRMTEAEEDDAMLQQHDEKVGVRFEETPPYIATGDMRDYQLCGLNWMITLYENGISGILADEMGLGKTLQTISLLGYLLHFKKMAGPHIVIVPKSTLQNWMNEMQRWCPTLKAVCLIGSEPERETIFRNELSDTDDYNVLVTSYEMIIKEKSRLHNIPWTYLIIDEGHRIKNENSLLAKVLRTFNCKARLLLTGTPLQNNLHELWALLNFLMPDIFDNPEDFDSWFDTDECLGDASIVERLHAILRPFVLRRIKSEVEKSLKPKKETKIFVGLSKMQREWYTKILMKDIDVLNSHNEKQKLRVANLLMHLRKCANHPYLFDGAEPGPPYTDDIHMVNNCGKMVVLDKLLPKLKEQGSRVLLFSQFTRILDILDDYCAWRGYDYSRLDGQTQHELRDKYIAEFNAPNSSKFIFMLSTRAGGLGINLATADVVILYDSDWNPQMDLQAMDRAHRIGQKKQVRVFRLITENTVDAKLVERAILKMHLDKMVIQQGRLTNSAVALKKDEQLQIIRYGVNYILSSKESDITDDDIDKILADSEEKTAEENKKFDGLSEDSLKMLKLGESMSVYQFEGKDWTNQAAKTPFEYIELPKRERKQLRVMVPETFAMVSMPPHLRNQPAMQDFQFYSPLIHAIFEKEKQYFYKQRKYVWPVELCDDDDDQMQRQQLIDQAAPLTADELAEKERLLDAAFSNWNKVSFTSYINLLKRYGREDMEAVANNVTDKTYEEVIDYNKVFWKRYREVNNYKVIVAAIKKKDAEIAEKNRVFEVLGKMMAECEDPIQQLAIPVVKSKGLGDQQFTIEEDRFLLCTLYGHGPSDDSYEKTRVDIRKATTLRFDNFIRSRTTAELKKRCTTLLKRISAADEKKKPTLVATDDVTVGADNGAAVVKATKRKAKEIIDKDDNNNAGQKMLKVEQN